MENAPLVSVVCPLYNTPKLYLRQMLDSVLEIFGVTPDFDLNIMTQGQTLTDITTRALVGLGEIFARERPDLVLVHGDTSTTFSTALACFYLRIPVGHVEAGLRTYDLYSPYPEEFNRQAVGIVARYHFAPTENARQNLLREGFSWWTAMNSNMRSFTVSRP